MTVTNVSLTIAYVDETLHVHGITVVVLFVYREIHIYLYTLGANEFISILINTDCTHDTKYIKSISLASSD